MTVHVEHLRKTYGPVTAVHDLSLDVPAGSFFAFLGANGAGKSTTIGCITTTLAPTSGSIRVCGHDVRTEASAVRRSIGAVFQQSLLDPLLSVRENLFARGRLYGMTRRDTSARIAELTPLVGLDAFLDQRYGRLSGGQKRRADIGRALLHRPSVVFLDEPTSGLDPQSREQIWSTIGRLRAENGTTVFLTTHYMEETERADRVCILARGAIAAEGTPGELRARHSSSVLTVRGRDLAGLASTFERRGLRTELSENDVRVHVSSADEARSLLDDEGIDDFEFRHGTMDDVFLQVTGGRIS